MGLTANKERFILAYTENLKAIWERSYPDDIKNIAKINDLVHDVCWKILEVEELNNDDNKV